MAPKTRRRPSPDSSAPDTDHTATADGYDDSNRVVGLTSDGLVIADFRWAHRGRSDRWAAYASIARCAA